jgi:hypothetical protein
MKNRKKKVSTIGCKRKVSRRAVDSDLVASFS